MTLLRFFLASCSSSGKEADGEENGNDQLSVHGFSFSTLISLSDSVCLTSTGTSHRKIIMMHETNC